MTINSNTQSFTSLNGAIKVTQISQLDSSSTTQTKKLTDSVSLNISSNSEPLKEETVIQSRNGYVNPEQKTRIKMLKEHYLSIVQENNQFKEYFHEQRTNPQREFFTISPEETDPLFDYYNEIGAENFDKTKLPEIKVWCLSSGWNIPCLSK